MIIKGKHLRGVRYSWAEFQVKVIANPEGQLLLFIISADGSIDLLLPADEIHKEMQRLVP